MGVDPSLRDEFARLGCLVLYRRAEDAEEARLVELLERSPELRAEWLKLLDVERLLPLALEDSEEEKRFARSLRVRILDRADGNQFLAATRDRILGIRRTRRRIWMAVAAALLVGMGVWLSLGFGVPPIIARLEGVAGRSDLRAGEGLMPATAAVVVFPDGTRLGLGKAARLSRVDDGKAGKRVAIASGLVEADVTKQPPDRAMVFVTPHGEIVVVGTVLAMEVGSDSTQLSVKEGHVRVKGRASVDVTAGQSVILEAGAVPVVRPILPLYQGKRSPPQGPLARLPSAPASHVAKIRALGDGQWLDLGRPARDPRWGSARGRSWTPKMAAAPDLGGAFLYGEGVHGFVKPDGYYMDDLWFYDANAHAWICAWPGTDTKNLAGYKLDERGFIVAADGECHPMASLVHGYNVPSYSSELKKFFGIGGTSYGCKEIGDLRSRLTPTREANLVNLDRKHPYFYDATTGRWERRKVSNGPAGIEVYGTTVAWLPTVRKFIMIFDAETWLYDPEANGWICARPKGTSPGGGEGLDCYDSKRHLLYRFKGGGDGKPGKFAAYDPAANAWIKLTEEFQPTVASGGDYYTHKGYAHYDAANDVVIVFLNGKQAPGAYVYDPGKDQWLREPAFAGPKKGGNAFYSAELNAHYFFEAGDSAPEPGVIHVWRYKKPKR